MVPTPRCSVLSEKCVFQAAFSGRLHFLTGLMLHTWQSRASSSLHEGAALPPQPCPASRAKQGHYTPKCGSAWEQRATATTHSPAEGRMCFLRSIWDRADLQLCLRHGEGVGGGSSGSGSRWQPVPSCWPMQHAAVAHGSAGQRELAHNAWPCSPCQCPVDLLPLTPLGLPAAAQPDLAALWGRMGS